MEEDSQPICCHLEKFNDLYVKSGKLNSVYLEIQKYAKKAKLVENLSFEEITKMRISNFGNFEEMELNTIVENECEYTKKCMVDLKL
jgi:hypothetical protein